MVFKQPSDVIASNSGSVIATVNGKNLNLAELKKVEAKLEKNVETVELLGRRMRGHKATSMEGTGSIAMYLVNSIWLKLDQSWKDGGAAPEISLTLTVDDPGTSAKKQVVQLTGVVFAESPIATLDSGDDLMEFETDFTFDDYKIIKEFNA